MTVKETAKNIILTQKFDNTKGNSDAVNRTRTDNSTVKKKWRKRHTIRSTNHYIEQDEPQKNQNRSKVQSVNRRYRDKAVPLANIYIIAHYNG